jgi:hypothetical protein
VTTFRVAIVEVLRLIHPARHGARFFAHAIAVRRPEEVFAKLATQSAISSKQPDVCLELVYIKPFVE